jgi:hypothetical protein
VLVRHFRRIYMLVNIQKLTLTLAVAVMMTVAGVALTPGNTVAQENEALRSEMPFADMDNDGVSDAVDVCPDTVIPERSVPGRALLPGRYALTDDNTIFNTHRGRESNYTLADTRGCSCEQIIELSGLNRNQRRFGCSRDVMRVFTTAMDAMPQVVPTPEEQQCQGELTRENPGEVLY